MHWECTWRETIPLVHSGYLISVWILNKYVHFIHHALWLLFVDIVTSKMLKIDSEDGHPSYWQCTDCEYKSYRKDSYNLKNHIESKHIISEGYNCSQCGKNVPTKNALRVHLARNHPYSHWCWNNKMCSCRYCFVEDAQDWQWGRPSILLAVCWLWLQII